MKAEEYGLDFTVTLTAEDAKFTDEAVAAGVPLIVVAMCRDALRKLVAAEREAVLQAIEAVYTLEEDRNPMFSDGYKYALDQIEAFIKTRKTNG
jgi:hypothetical protein